MTSLVAEAQYRRWTGDKVNAWLDVGPFLDDALATIEEYLDRTLTLGDHTERLRINYKPPGAYQYIGYFVYPKAPPIQSITAPANGVIYGDLIVGVSPPTIFGSGIWGDDLADYATVEYTGGFDQTTLPETLGKAISRLAYSNLNPNPVTRRLPSEATAIRQGDLAIQFKQSGFRGDFVLPRDMRVAIKPWRRTVIIP